ncbi:serpin family protein [Pseudobdellovibrio sp. HCB154]|uniref:serpin family protein n=1 Tax=Pseudobdellovibrio sp. HCB154 TaxID=3386277 RepID=UPI0039170C30
MLKWILGLTFLSQSVVAGPMNDILTAQYLKKKKSFIYSPLSLDVALSMTAEGSAGETRQQFKKILALPNSEIYKKLNVKHSDYEFVSAQKVWVQQDYPIEAAFEKTLKESYQSALEKADFKTKSAEVVPVINKWVEEKTKEKIKDLIPANGLNALTRFVLVNAVYFKAKWLSEFDANSTEEADFKVDHSTKIKVSMMFKKFHGLKYFEGKDFTSVILPYQGDDISFVVFLPKTIGGEFKPNFLKNISKVKDSDYKEPAVNVYLPKFKTEFSTEVENDLKTVGLTLPFDKVKADFSLMSPLVKTAKEENLYISKIFHKAFVEVGEKGTEAAAATAVVMMTMGAALPVEKPKEFKADHPFIYFIKQKDQILFAGYFAGNK